MMKYKEVTAEYSFGLAITSSIKSYSEVAEVEQNQSTYQAPHQTLPAYLVF